MKRLALTTILLLTLSSLLFSQEVKSESNKEIELFTTIDNAMIKAETEPVVLFFYASWCPSCRSAKNEIEANLDKLDGINLLLVDYDKSSELKQKYGVTYQHTYVQIDSAGNKMAIWNGGSTENILKKVIRREMP